MALNKFIVPTIVVLALIFSYPFFRPGLPITDDLPHMVLRAQAFHLAFIDGQIPVRFLPQLNENYGYPVTNFLYPLPFYFAEVFQLLSLSSLVSIKLVIVLSLIAGSIGVYLWTRAHAPPLASFLAAVFYLWSPFRLFHTYQRGALGEILTFAIIPFSFYFFDRVHQRPTLSSFLLTVISLSLVILSHNTLGLIFLICFFLFAVFHQLSKRSPTAFWIRLGLLLLITLGMSAFFTLPALFELGFTRAPSIQISNLSHHFLSLSQLLQIIGPITILILIVSLFTSKLRPIAIFVLIPVLLQFEFTKPLWELGGLDFLVQFPHRLLAIPHLFSAFFLAYLLSRLPKSKLPLSLLSLPLIVIPLVSLTNLKYQTFPPEYFKHNFDTTTNQREFTPIWVKTDPQTLAIKPYSFDSLIKPQVITSTKTATQTYLQIITHAPTEVTFNTHYYPGWKLLVNDVEVQPHLNPTGTLSTSINTQAETNKRFDLKLVWSETPLRLTSNLISALTIFLSLAFLTFARSRSLQTTLGLLSLLIIFLNLFTQAITHRHELLAVFDPVLSKQQYLDSQWVNPKSQSPIGDHGLYSWAGWAYLHGENPVLINPEMPPLGKYLIGLGLVFTRRPGIVSAFFFILSLVSFYALNLKVLKNYSLALVPIALMSFERIYLSLLTIPMLDTLQLTFLFLAFYLLINPRGKWSFMLAGLCLGGVLTTKFYVGGLLVIFSLASYFLITRQFNHLKNYLLALPLSFLVHLASYTNYFLHGNSLRSYLGVQKFIYEFYRSGAPSVPIGSYWLLVLFNRWRVWWGAAWGEFYTLTTQEWRPLWPVAVIILIYFSFQYARRLKSRSSPSHSSVYLLVHWLLVYSLFLTFIGGWPHYLLLFLPFAYLLLIYLLKTKLIHE